MAFGQYILDKDGNPVPEPDLIRWALWLEFSHLALDKSNRIVAQDEILGVRVSTVFLGLDYGHPRDRPHKPILWETMIFRGPHDGYCRRYTSRADAEQGHREAIELVKNTDPNLERELQIERIWLRFTESGDWKKLQ